MPRPLLPSDVGGGEFLRVEELFPFLTTQVVGS